RLSLRDALPISAHLQIALAVKAEAVIRLFAAVDGCVIPQAAIEDVIARAAGQHIVAITTTQNDVAVSDPGQFIVSIAALDHREGVANRFAISGIALAVQRGAVVAIFVGRSPDNDEPAILQSGSLGFVKASRLADDKRVGKRLEIGT